MKITTVLFDLDGTLLPMDQDDFIKAYSGGLTATAGGICASVLFALLASVLFRSKPKN